MKPKPLTIFLIFCLVIVSVVNAEWKQEKLSVLGGASGDQFGYSVAIDGNIAVVGSPRSDSPSGGEDSGAAYVFKRTGNRWNLLQKLVASDGAEKDGFGGNVAISGGCIAVGSIGHDGRGADAGVVYVYELNNGKWIQHSKLFGEDTGEGDAFGQAIAISKNLMVIGAPHDDERGKSSGSVTVFEKIDDKWIEQTKLVAPDGRAEDVFGINVAVCGDTILIGADLNDESVNNGGAAYVFVGDRNNWEFQSKLIPNDPGDTDIFGVRVSLSGETALISARRDDNQFGVDAGSAYVFVRKGESDWIQEAKLVAPDGAADDRFGRGVAIKDDTAFISALHQDDRGENSGAVYVFNRIVDKWIFSQKMLAKDGQAGDLFGWNIALSEDTAIVGAIRNSDQGVQSGSAYIFKIPER
jgi:phage pi2 protein 07